MLLGNRNDVYRLYQAMDVFVFPSRYEGLGMAAVEAQFCGVTTVMSDKVPEDAVISNNALKISLKSSTNEWAKSVLSEKTIGKINHNGCLEYDISKKSTKLINYYGETLYGRKRITVYSRQRFVPWQQE